ncbi:MAG: phytoene desaturase family protein [Thermocrispum sp.]
MQGTAVVVGAGPNGLAAAITLARGGLQVTVLEAAGTIGGGTRSGELTVPGVLHDHCSSTHPLAAASPFLRSVDLQRLGVRWCLPEVDLAHPLDHGEPGVLVRAHDLAGVDARRWRSVFGPLADGLDALAGDLLQPLVRIPRHPVRLARFGLRGLLPATVLARRWRTEQARALFAGCAAHSFAPLTSPTTGAIALMLLAAGHRYGWPVAEGGSQTITTALAAALTELGGKIETGVLVRSPADLPRADVVMLDLAPRAAADVLGDRLPARVAMAYRRWRHGPAAFKVSLAVEGGAPWRDESCRRAGFVHVGGSLADIARAEQEVFAGRMTDRPFVLVAQQYLADPSRSAGTVHPIDTYTHVPHDYPGDATDAILAQLERFAPGLRERIVGQYVSTPGDLAAANPNFVGGDIASGANTPLQVVLRPRPTTRPYHTGVPGVYLCSAATPPGAGVHGMCGYNAARTALRAL